MKLSDAERKTLKEIYKEAGLREVKPNTRALRRYRKKVEAGLVK